MVGDEPPRRSPSEEETRGRSRTWGAEIYSDDGSNNGDECTSEKEWEGWEGDLLSRRARRDTSIESELNWAASWIYTSGGFTISPSSDYTFPSSLSRTDMEQDPVAQPHKTLSSYSSADSLLRRTIKRASPRKRRPIPSRSDSPSLLGIRPRPRSPLADYSDYDDEQSGSSPQLLFDQPPRQVAYPSRQSSFESGTSYRSSYLPSTRASLPIAMAMTTITSTVSVGSDVAQDKKGKGKAKQVDKPVTRPTHRRSSTVQASPNMNAKEAQTGRAQPIAFQQQQIRPPISTAGSSGSISSRIDAESTDVKPGRLKLSLSFAQVASFGTVTASSGRLPSSATSGSSFESPRFARPEDSD